MLRTKKFFPRALLLALLAFTLVQFGCGQQTAAPAKVLFTDPAQKIIELSDANFSSKLLAEAVTLSPNLLQSNSHVYMGYWSGTWPAPSIWNRTNLVTVLDAINGAVTTEATYGIWDEGTTTAASSQYPSYITMNKEYWYERAGFKNGVGSIEGVWYYDPHPVTFAQADQIWGIYSQKYGDMATLIRSQTGRTPEALCFVNGAKVNRIFFAFELPELVTLEAKGDVIVRFPTTYEAKWDNPAQWLTGTNNAPTPLPASTITTLINKAYN